MSTGRSETKSMALFCDFENVALGVKDAKYTKFDIKKVLERLLLKGSIVVKKAYCDWERYREFKSAMHQAAFELIEIPHVRMSGKNSADIRMVVDALDLCYTKSHVDTFVIISGDSDFSPLVSKLRENAKTVIGVGVKNSTSDLLIANCDEFIYYDDLVRGQPPARAPRGRAGTPARGAGPRKDVPAATPPPVIPAAPVVSAASLSRVEPVRDEALPEPATAPTEGAGVVPVAEAPAESAEAAVPAKAKSRAAAKPRSGVRGRRKTPAADAETVPASVDGEAPVALPAADAPAVDGDASQKELALVEPVSEAPRKRTRRSTRKAGAAEPLPEAPAEPASEPVPEPSPEPAAESAPEPPVEDLAEERTLEAIELVLRTVEALAAERGYDDKVWGSMVKQTLKRQRPGFNENYYGFRSFNSLLEEARDRGLIELERDEKSGGYTVRSLA